MTENINIDYIEQQVKNLGVEDYFIGVFGNNFKKKNDDYTKILCNNFEAIVDGNISADSVGSCVIGFTGVSNNTFDDYIDKSKFIDTVKYLNKKCKNKEEGIDEYIRWLNRCASSVLIGNEIAEANSSMEDRSREVNTDPEVNNHCLLI